MADMFDDQRFREQIEALMLAIGAIRGHAAPDRHVLDAIVRHEVDRANAAQHANMGTLDLETVTRLVEALARWHEADAVRRG